MVIYHRTVKKLSAVFIKLWIIFTDLNMEIRVPSKFFKPIKFLHSPRSRNPCRELLHSRSQTRIRVPNSITQKNPFLFFLRRFIKVHPIKLMNLRITRARNNIESAINHYKQKIPNIKNKLINE